MMKTMKTDPLEQLLSLRWVESAERCDEYGTERYSVVTKPGMFHAELTHSIEVGLDMYGSEYTCGELLDAPIRIELPQYRIWLYPSGDGYLFKFGLVNKPAAPKDYIAVIPQYHSTVQKYRFAQEYSPCISYGEGSSYETYPLAKDWGERANEAVYYLQTAIPHHGYNWYTTVFAYLLGLVGSEVIIQQEIAEELITTI